MPVTAKPISSEPRDPFPAVTHVKSPQKRLFSKVCRVVVPIRLSDDGIEARLEPLDGVVTVDAVGGTDSALAAATANDTLTGAGHAAVEVHAVDTNTGVVLDTKVDVLADTESEVAGLAEVALAELVLLDLEATLENLLGLGATDGDVDGDLFVTTDTEGTDGVTGLAWKRKRLLGLSSRSIITARASQFASGTYCRQESDQTAAQAPWRHGSICHQTRQRRC